MNHLKQPVIPRSSEIVSRFASRAGDTNFMERLAKRASNPETMLRIREYSDFCRVFGDRLDKAMRMNEVERNLHLLYLVWGATDAGLFRTAILDIAPRITDLGVRYEAMLHAIYELAKKGMVQETKRYANLIPASEPKWRAAGYLYVAHAHMAASNKLKAEGNPAKANEQHMLAVSYLVYSGFIERGASPSNL